MILNHKSLASQGPLESRKHPLGSVDPNRVMLDQERTPNLLPLVKLWAVARVRMKRMNGLLFKSSMHFCTMKSKSSLKLEKRKEGGSWKLNLINKKKQKTLRNRRWRRKQINMLKHRKPIWNSSMTGKRRKRDRNNGKYNKRNSNETLSLKLWKTGEGKKQRTTWSKKSLRWTD